VQLSSQDDDGRGLTVAEALFITDYEPKVLTDMADQYEFILFK